ncbi:uncharacterized protein LY79DRAFT_577684 [Colletotrichum navitas]|uniref:Uncharacterized protein n=1 Tax=Colletotrichum navitas TaxID=681940 RepID=A0AAD8V8I4_9PEZI|nr:uncharacterized protein LY79DRAFT_577684 [Colletotrichum navitas]KAK1595716.1 hypothetical protein LY79DRAFT_577684 [Colletotrichum navitas]
MDLADWLLGPGGRTKVPTSYMPTGYRGVHSRKNGEIPKQGKAKQGHTRPERAKGTSSCYSPGKQEGTSHGAADEREKDSTHQHPPTSTGTTLYYLSRTGPEKENGFLAVFHDTMVQAKIRQRRQSVRAARLCAKTYTPHDRNTIVSTVYFQVLSPPTITNLNSPEHVQDTAKKESRPPV